MTVQQYAIARSMAAEWVGPAAPRRYYLGCGIPVDLPGHATAVYITELGDGRVAYVGQTRRGTAARLTEHARRWERSSRWSYVWVIPILDAVPERELDRIEGRVGQLLDPGDSTRLPRL